MTETMTIHEALAELKTLDNRIQNGIDRGSFVTANRHGNSKIKGKPISDFVADAKDSYKSIMSLISRRSALKKAVAKSNATTTVTIAGRTMTVAEAIEEKNHGMYFLNQLRAKMDSQLLEATRLCDRENNMLPEKADEYVARMYSAVDQKNASEEVRKMKEDFTVAQTYELVDPLDVVDIISDLEKTTSSFLTKVDAALSVANAVTTIEIEYPTF